MKQQPITKLNKELINHMLDNEYPIDLILDNNLNIINDEIQVTKDEDLNDFFVSWKKFGSRPSKITIFSQFYSKGIWDILNNEFEVQDSSINKMSDIFTDSMGVIHNIKYFIDITDDISISFFEFDKELNEDDNDEIYTSNVIIYYNQNSVSSEYMNDILSLFLRTIVDVINYKESFHRTVNILHIGTHNDFELKPILLNKYLGDKEMKSYYTTKIIKSGKESIELINNNKKGLTILTGERGNGKTTFLLHMINKINKNVIYIPNTMFENTLTNIDFIHFLKSNPNSVLILDDCEIYFNNNQKINMYTLNLLQILEGLDSDSLNINFILSMNIDINCLDKNLLQSNRFLSNILFDKLDKRKSTSLSKRLGKNVKYINSAKLIDVINGKLTKDNSTYY